MIHLLDLLVTVKPPHHRLGIHLHARRPAACHLAHAIGVVCCRCRRWSAFTFAALTVTASSAPDTGVAQVRITST